MTSLGLRALIFGVVGLGSLGIVLLDTLAAVAVYVVLAAWELGERQEPMDWTWHMRFAKFIVIFLSAADSTTKGSLTVNLALGKRTTQWAFAEESKYSASSFSCSSSFSLISVASRGEACMPKRACGSFLPH